MRRAIYVLVISLTFASMAEAGSVTASISGGNLYVYGDDANSTIAIDSLNNGQIRVIGLPTHLGQSTFVNGQENGSVVLDGWNGGIFAFMYGARDSVTLSSAIVDGTVHIDLGEGNDELFIGTSPIAQAANAAAEEMGVSGEMLAQALDPVDASVIVQEALVIIGANGNDYVDLLQTLVIGGATFDMGAGADDLYLGILSMDQTSVDFRSNCVIVPGTEADDVYLESMEVGHNLIVDDSTLRLRLVMTDVTVGNSLFVYGTPAADRIDLAAVSVGDLLRIISEDGNDVVIVRGSSNNADLFPGAGSDRVRIVDFVSQLANVYLDPGHDDFMLQRGSLQRLNAFGSSGNDIFSIRYATIVEAYLYGESGTDTYAGVPGNNIGSLNLYTIENQ